MNINLSLQTGFFFILMLLITLASCKKDPMEVGLDVQPIEDRINVKYSDSTSLIAYSRANDSIRTDNTALSLLGSYVDPVFGRTSAGFFTQFLLSNVKPDFGSDPVLDSMILSLAINGYYGDTNTPMLIKVYEITEKLFYDSSYYSHSTLEYNPVELCSYTYLPRPSDTVMVDSVKYPAHIRLNIGQNPDVANRILNGPSEDLADNEKFVEFVKGLYITAEPVYSSGSILQISLTSELTKILLHYRNAEKDSLKYQFRIDEGCARFNRFAHDYSFGSPSFQAQIVGKDTSLGAQTLYLQAMQGINTYIHFPYLTSWTKNSGIAITRAELVLPIINTRNLLSPPAQLLIGSFKDNEVVQIVDQSEGTSFVGGVYDSTRMEYRFRVTRHIQQILSGSTENYPLTILVSGRAIQSNRVILGGPEYVAARSRLELVYVEVPKK